MRTMEDNLDRVAASIRENGKHKLHSTEPQTRVVPRYMPQTNPIVAESPPSPALTELRACQTTIQHRNNGSLSAPLRMHCACKITVVNIRRIDLYPHLHARIHIYRRRQRRVIFKTYINKTTVLNSSDRSTFSRRGSVDIDPATTKIICHQRMDYTRLSKKLAADVFCC